MKKLASMSIAVAEAIRDREEFDTYGALRARKVASGSYGQLSGADLERFLSDFLSDAGIEYIVYSYSTPIAWVSNGTPYRVKARFSVTTSKHQSKLYLLGD